MLFGLLLCVVVVMAAFPETPVARQLRHWLVEAPAAWFAQLSKRTLFVFAGILVFTSLFVLAIHFEPELIFLLIGAGEAASALAAVADVSLLFEVMLLVWMAAAAGVLKTVWRTARGIVSYAATLPGRMLRRRGRRAPRKRAVRKPSPAKPDDAPAAGWTFA